jgi:ATP-dependent RNA helicase RhlE
MQFSELPLSQPLQRAIADTGYVTPTPIQQRAIPIVVTGRDLLGVAQTGTGKTAAFALPILERLMATKPHAGERGQRKPIRCLVLTPTRELALQIGESFSTYGRFAGLHHTVIFGGVGQRPQEDALRRGIDTVIACPGRLLDLMNQGFVDLRHLQVFVLDEADRMLDMGFIHDIRKIVAKIPQQRQTLFFSATMPKEIRELASSLLHDPATVEVAPVSSSAETVEQSVYHVDRGHKPALLKHLLTDASWKKVLVFTRTKHGADKVVRWLEQSGTRSAAIHGNKSQNARVRALESFRDGGIRVLVASDIAARGIDIDNITHVVNYDVPHEPETYVHRIGRTGRAGNSGIAVSLCDQEERADLRTIERLIRKPIPEADHPFKGVPPPPRPPQQAQGQRFGRFGGNRRDDHRGQRHGQRPQHGQRDHGQRDHGQADRRDERDERDLGHPRPERIQHAASHQAPRPHGHGHQRPHGRPPGRSDGFRSNFGH